MKSSSRYVSQDFFVSSLFPAIFWLDKARLDSLMIIYSKLTFFTNLFSFSFQQEERVKENEQRWLEEKDVMTKRVEECNQEFERLSRQRSELESQQPERPSAQNEEYAQVLERERNLQTKLRTYEDELTQKEIKIQRLKEAYAQVCLSFEFVMIL